MDVIDLMPDVAADLNALRNSLGTVQSAAASGARKIGADFLHHHFPESEFYVSDPTWENLIGIFEGAAF